MRCVSAGREAGSHVVNDRRDPSLPRAMSAAKKCALSFDAVTHDLASTVLANGSELVDGALEAVKSMGAAGCHYLK
jgi:hypothetical protein